MSHRRHSTLFSASHQPAQPPSHQIQFGIPPDQANRRPQPAQTIDPLPPLYERPSVPVLVQPRKPTTPPPRMLAAGGHQRHLVAGPGRPVPAIFLLSPFPSSLLLLLLAPHLSFSASHRRPPEEPCSLASRGAPLHPNLPGNHHLVPAVLQLIAAPASSARAGDQAADDHRVCSIQPWAPPSRSSAPRPQGLASARTRHGAAALGRFSVFSGHLDSSPAPATPSSFCFIPSSAQPPRSTLAKSSSASSRCI